jgi:transaldolase / glucose-6-phosphate isomerase
MSHVRATASLGSYQAIVETAVKKLAETGVWRRIGEKDYTLWKPSPVEIVNRLGWLDCPTAMAAHLNRIRAFVEEVRTDGYTRVLLLGMGGSSLAPEVFRKVFGVAPGYLDLTVLDSTDPGRVLAVAEGIDPAKTLFIVSTKSGGTVETFSFMKYFFNLMSEKLGPEEAGRHFIAITDPGSALAELAAIHRFRTVFLNDPNIGGRYSALSCFGLVPAALLGVDIETLLARAARMADHEADSARPEVVGDVMTGAYLGAALGELTKGGWDKATFVFSPRLASFGDWLEQLIAESTGKEGKGILPVIGRSEEHTSELQSPCRLR